MAKVEFKFDSEASDQGASRKRLDDANPLIGLVSSIAYTADMKAGFEKGLDGRVDIYDPPKVGLGYKQNDLDQAIVDLNDKVSLIVTMGGNIAYEAARRKAQQPFISLLGVKPDSVARTFADAILLNSYEANLDRYQILTRDLKVAESDIALFSNKNSRMHGAEGGHWEQKIGTPPNKRVVEGGNKSGENDPGVFATDFSGIPTASGPLSTVRALIISADPFFGENRAALVAVANKWIDDGAKAKTNRYVVYPSLSYSDVGTLSANSVFYGPEKGNPYEMLGQLAAIAATIPTSVFLGYWPVTNKRL